LGIYKGEEEYLLDYDSDSNAPDTEPGTVRMVVAEELAQRVSARAEHVDMETDQPIAGLSSRSRGVESETSTMHAVYFQCRSARVSGYKMF
jgi:hypothetical protein